MRRAPSGAAPVAAVALRLRDPAVTIAPPMGELWTRDRALQIAPDAASAKAGEALASVRKWVSLGHDERSVWGECQGSGARPYQVQADLSDVAVKCSCPSRKFPCKHGIGLMLLHADNQTPLATPPEWVTQWLASRTERKEKKSQAPLDVSPEAQARRAEAQQQRRGKRLDLVLAGLHDLQRWLEDTIQSGLATMPSRGWAPFEQRAKRLIDAQAPGAARWVRDIGSAAASGEGWQQRTLEAMSLTYLLAVAAGRLDSLSLDLREDVLATLGLPTAKEALDALPAVQDIWQVLGREVEIEANLKTQRTYLFGLQTRRPAMLLDFAYGNAGLNLAVPVGTLYPAELVFYQGNSHRAAVRTAGEAAPLSRLAGIDSIHAMLDQHASLLARHPWLWPTGFPLKQAKLMIEAGQWWLVDQQGDALPLTPRGRSGWVALAVSAGRRVDLAVITNGRWARPLSVVADEQFTDLSIIPSDTIA